MTCRKCEHDMSKHDALGCEFPTCTCLETPQKVEVEQMQKREVEEQNTYRRVIGDLRQLTIFLDQWADAEYNNMPTYNKIVTAGKFAYKAWQDLASVADQNAWKAGLE